MNYMICVKLEYNLNQITKLELSIMLLVLFFDTSNVLAKCINWWLLKETNGI